MAISPLSASTFVLQSDGNLGGLQVLMFIGLILFGVGLSQAYVYFSRTEDQLSLRVLVAILIVLETCHSFTACQIIYVDTVTQFLTNQPNSYALTATGFLENLITVIVQSFFTYRVYRLSESLLLGIACSVLVMLRFVGGMVLVGSNFADVPSLTATISLVERLSWLITSSLTCGAAADVIIAASMLHYLKRMNLDSNTKSTTSIINRLVKYSFQTGLVTSLTSMGVIISFQALESLVCFGFYILVAKVYSNSLLVWVNAKTTMRRQILVTSADIGTVPTIAFATSAHTVPSFTAPNNSFIEHNVYPSDIYLAYYDRMQPRKQDSKDGNKLIDGL